MDTGNGKALNNIFALAQTCCTYTYVVVNTTITEVNLSVFDYRLFHEDFSPILGLKFVPRIGDKSS